MHDNDAKREIMLSVYASNRDKVEYYRTMVVKVTVTLASVCLLFVGWMVSDKSSNLNGVDRAVIWVGIFIIMFIGLGFISHFEQSFKSASKVVKKIDDAMKLFEEGYYFPGTVYPKEWNEYGSENWKEPAFQYACLAMILIPIFSFVAAWII